jgi:formylglycine-generating enzyme required for sulfatase activity
MTQAQWLRTAGSNPSWFQESGVNAAYPMTSPVETIMWTDADELVRRMGLRLPTEAQWEYGARAGTTTVWWIGNDAAAIGPERDRAGNIFDQRRKKSGYLGNPEAWDDGFVDVAPVGTFAANGFGLHDVLGNVSELCEDEYVDYESSPASPGDGHRAAPVQAGSRGHVYRGGSWPAGAVNARSADRLRIDPFHRHHDLGLRPARVITE